MYQYGGKKVLEFNNLCSVLLLFDGKKRLFNRVMTALRIFHNYLYIFKINVELCVLHYASGLY